VKELTVRICNPKGLHARPSAQFSSIAKKFDCCITVAKDNHAADGKSIMGLLSLAATHETTLNIRLVGPEAEAAAHSLLDECSDFISIESEQNL